MIALTSGALTAVCLSIGLTMAGATTADAGQHSAAPAARQPVLPCQYSKVFGKTTVKVRKKEALVRVHWAAESVIPPGGWQQGWSPTWIWGAWVTKGKVPDMDATRRQVYRQSDGASIPEAMFRVYRAKGSKAVTITFGVAPLITFDKDGQPVSSTGPTDCTRMKINWRLNV